MRNSPPDYVLQPGPDGAPYSLARTGVVDLDFEIPAGCSLHDGIDRELKKRGLSGGYFRIVDAPMSGMRYVIPGLSPDDKHVAWYSDTYVAPMPGFIQDAGINCGALGDAAFFHCHGIMRGPDGTTTMGHLFPETCLFSKPTYITGIGFPEARFNRVGDPQTGFDLFVAEQTRTAPENPDALLLRLTPNIDFNQTLIDVCREAGWTMADVFCVGSIIGARFADGRLMESFATEFFVTDGKIDLTGSTDEARTEIAIVGLDGTYLQGLLTNTGNPVLITCEVVLRRIPQ